MCRLPTLCLAVAIAILWAAGGDGRSQSREAPRRGPLQDPRTDPARDTGSPPGAYTERRQPWLLGDLLYDREYRGTVAVTNHCAGEQRFGLFAYDLPDLVIAPTVTLAAGETARLPYVLAPRQRSSDTTAAIAGELVIWRPGSDPACPPLRVVHAARGRLRNATPADEDAETRALQDAATRAACAHWWLRGEPPDTQQIGMLPAAARPGAARAEAAGCADLVRPAARNLRERLAEEDRNAGSRTWTWLPDAAAFDRMSITELAAFRRRVVETEVAGKGR